VLGVQRRQAGEVGGDHPELALREIDLVDPDVAREVLVARQEAGVVLADRLDLRGHRRKVPIVEDLGPGADRDAPGRHGEPHRPGEVAEMGVELPGVVAGGDQLSGLVGRDDHRAVQLVQELREALRVDTAQRRIGRRRPLRGPRRLDRTREELAGTVGELLRPRQQLAQLRRHLGSTVSVGDRELIAQRAERARDLLGGLDRDELADALELAQRIVHQGLEVGDAPTLRRQALEVVEQRSRQPDPLLGDDLMNR
jgi:hypothetical protein